MARTTGPMFSQDASGSIGKIFTHSHWKGRTYVKKHSIPSNPQSGRQNAVRTILAFASSAWSLTLTDGMKELWATLALEKQLTPSNAMVGDALNRFTQEKLPQQIPDSPAAPTDGVWATLPTPTGQVRSIKWDWDLTTINDVWGALYWAAPTGIPVPDAETLRTQSVITATGIGSTTDIQLPADTYDTAVIIFSTSGEVLNFAAYAGIVVT